VSPRKPKRWVVVEDGARAGTPPVAGPFATEREAFAEVTRLDGTDGDGHLAEPLYGRPPKGWLQKNWVRRELAERGDSYAVIGWRDADHPVFVLTWSAHAAAQSRRKMLDEFLGNVQVLAPVTGPGAGAVGEKFYPAELPLGVNISYQSAHSTETGFVEQVGPSVDAHTMRAFVRKPNAVLVELSLPARRRVLVVSPDDQGMNPTL
jgi:hypothetical protein